MEREPLISTSPKAKRSPWLAILAGVLIVGLIGGVAFEHFKSAEVTVADDGLHGYTEPTETLAVELGDRTEASMAQGDADATAAAADGTTGAPAAADETTAAAAAAADETTGAAPAADETTAAAPAADGTAAPEADGTAAPAAAVTTAEGTTAAAGTTASPAEPTVVPDQTEATGEAIHSPDGSITVDDSATDEPEEETTHPAQVHDPCDEKESALIHNCMTMNDASKEAECDAAPNCSFKADGCDFGYTKLQCVPSVSAECLYDIEIEDGDDLYAVMQPGGVCPKVDSSASQITFVLAATLFISWWM